MAGQIRAMIDRIIAERSRGNTTIATTTKTKLILKGFDPERYAATTPDDRMAIERLRQIAVELNVSLGDLA